MAHVGVGVGGVDEVLLGGYVLGEGWVLLECAQGWQVYSQGPRQGWPRK